MNGPVRALLRAAIGSRMAYGMYSSEVLAVLFFAWATVRQPCQLTRSGALDCCGEMARVSLPAVTGFGIRQRTGP